ncbi:hypothetical protein NXX50_13105 [Bacteroides fragilis]|nr:hypothetical protein [Bacteroides fragilis]
MKIAEIKEMSTNDLVERVEAEVVNYNQMVINHSISPLEKSCADQTITQDDCAYENRVTPKRT